jgi:hypothetical protein
MARRVHQRGLAALVCALSAGPGSSAGLEVLQSYVWAVDDSDFGGMSGILVDAGGEHMTAISDQGTIWQADIARDAAGRIDAITTTFRARLKDSKGAEVSGFRQDAEDLARGANGRVFVAFEGYARISGFDLPDLQPVALHDWEAFRKDWGNEAFEGLAMLSGGHLLAVIERAKDGAFLTFTETAAGWSAGPPIPAGEGGFAVAGADVGPDGRLYLLERRTTFLMSFVTRIRRFDVGPLGASEGEVVFQSEAGDLPNMEGISLWEAPDGATMVTLISDNAFNGTDTVVAEYRLME